jgi:hypothetical protein
MHFANTTPVHGGALLIPIGTQGAIFTSIRVIHLAHHFVTKVWCVMESDSSKDFVHFAELFDTISGWPFAIYFQ